MKDVFKYLKWVCKTAGAIDFLFILTIVVLANLSMYLILSLLLIHYIEIIIIASLGIFYIVLVEFHISWGHFRKIHPTEEDQIILKLKGTRHEEDIKKGW